MRNIVALLASIIPVVGIIPYLIDSFKNKTKPNVVTWFTWTLINGINAAAALSDGAYTTALYSALGVVATGSIVVVGLLRHGIKRYTRFDIVCQIVALLGIPLWLLTNEPALAVLLILFVDFAGGLPTLRHAFRAPHEETWQTFALSAFGGFLLVASLERFDFVALGLPLYIFLFDSLVLAVIFSRLRMVRRRTTV